MSTTTSLGLHKPDISDNVLATIPELAENFQEINDYLEQAASDTGWTAMAAQGGGTIQHRKRAGVVFVSLSNVAASTTSWLQLGTLPAGYRPDIEVRAPLTYNAGGAQNGEVHIDTNGVVKTYGTNASPYWYGLLSFPI